MTPRGIYRLDMGIPEEAGIHLVRLIFMGLAVDHDKNPNVFAIYEARERAGQELHILLDEACRAALN
jgi:hypothetical protein